MEEREVAEALARHLRERYQCDLFHRRGVNVAKVPGVFPTQPEVDLVLYCREGMRLKPPIIATEIKYIRGTPSGMSWSYYSGLDEAIALLLLGFDYVLLVHIIDEIALKTRYLEYAKALSGLIQRLGVPVGYRVYASTRVDGTISIYRMLEIGDTGHFIDLKDFWVDPRPNLLLELDDELGKRARANRSLILEYLSRGRPR
ncbi:MAG: hypothetical protein QW700_07960 [Desulfurococcaceae archaeon]|uniref:hypothetical protein n=1 Tax=Pyrobaculum sp. TaxID=2004705 RepID=UPI00315EE744